MKKVYFLLMLVMGGVSGVWGQTPNGTLDFGTVANGTTATTANTGFGGVRVGTGGGGFTLQNPGQSIGADAELKGIAPTGGSINSVGITSTEYGTATTTFTVSFELHLSGGSSGTWYFFAGNGATFAATQSATFTGAQIFTGIQWVFGASNAITANNRAAGAWAAMSGTPFAQNTSYFVTIVGNNSASTVNYGAAQSIAANTYDLWINGSLVGNDLAKAQLGAATAINAFRFYGENSTGNVAAIALDNIRWYNSAVLPATHLVFNGVPATGTTSTNLSSFSVEAHSGSTTGPLANLFTNTITLSKATGFGNISGTLAPSAVAGVATFNDVQFDAADTYTMDATAASPAIKATSSSVVISAGAAPSISISGTPLSAFSTTAGTPSASQSYTVSGSNLTNDILITAPAGYEIKSPLTSYGSSVTLTQTAGTVNNTQIDVRLNSVTGGPFVGNITHISTGATQKDVAVTGNVLATEPSVQSAITFGAITTNSIVVNFSGGDGAKRILVAKANAAVDSDPVDGTTYGNGAGVFTAGTQLGTLNYVVYAGTGNTVTVTGLAGGTTYHFAVYEYNDNNISGAENYLTLSPGINNTATGVATYTWSGGNSAWTTAANWTPARTVPASTDILQFNDGTSVTVTGVPVEAIGQLNVTNNTSVTLQAAISGTLSINGLAGTDLTVAAGSQLNISGTNGYTINLITGATASIDGSMNFSSVAAHKLTAADASAITFNNGAVFTAGTGLTGNVFGTTSLNSVVFASGSVYVQQGGSNPFGAGQPSSVVVFQTGSLYRIEGNFTPSLSGRTYANLELNSSVAPISGSGTAVLNIDDLTITQGSFSIGMTGTFNIRGNIAVASGATLILAPSPAGTLTLSGASSQSISNSGTLTFGTNQSVTVNNASGVTLNTDVALGTAATLTLTNGNIILGNSNLTVSAVSGGSATSYISTNGSGALTIRNVTTIKNFPVGNGATYTPATLTNTGTADDFTVNVAAGTPCNADPFQSVNRVWTITEATPGGSVADITMQWNQADENLTFIRLLCTAVHCAGGVVDLKGTNSTAGGSNPYTQTITGISSFSPFGVTSDNLVLPISIQYFNGYKQNDKHNLSWKINCNSSPGATMTIERSGDGRSFNPIYTITADAVRCLDAFSYTDVNPLQGINYYRLKSVDASGRITYSSIITLLNKEKGFEIVNITPNPTVNGQFKLNVTTTQQAKMDVVITDMAGRVVSKKTISLSSGFNAIDMSIGNLANGSYQLYGTTTDGKTSTISIIKQ
jgi:hypothetical protein